MSAVKRCWLILILAPTMAWSQGPAANEDGGHAKLFDLDAGVGDKVAVGWMGDPQVKLPDDWTFFEAENETSDSDCAKKVSLQRPGQLFVGDFHSNQDFLKVSDRPCRVLEMRPRDETCCFPDQGPLFHRLGVLHPRPGPELLCQADRHH